VQLAFNLSLSQVSDYDVISVQAVLVSGQSCSTQRLPQAPAMASGKNESQESEKLGVVEDNHLTNDSHDSEQQEDHPAILEHSFCIRMVDATKGRGLVATFDIPARTLIHIAPCIPISRKEYEMHMRFTVLEHYLFNGTNGNKLLALGYGSLFNHSGRPNVDYRIDMEGQCVRYFSGLHTIRKGEELCITYGSNLWFDESNGMKNDVVAHDETIEDILAAFSQIEVVGADDGA